MSTYRKASSFGASTKHSVNNPLTYCMDENIDNMFMHGGNSDVYGPHGASCQRFMPQYCEKKWDGFCEVASMNTNSKYPSLGSNTKHHMGQLTRGEQLIHATATRKYLVEMYGGKEVTEPFDYTVPDSPMITYWIGYREPVYAVSPKDLDKDPVMNKILDRPYIGIDILENIYMTMRRRGTLDTLKGTRLYAFFKKNFMQNKK